MEHQHKNCHNATCAFCGSNSRFVGLNKPSNRRTAHSSQDEESKTQRNINKKMKTWICTARKTIFRDFELVFSQSCVDGLDLFFYFLNWGKILIFQVLNNKFGAWIFEKQTFLSSTDKTKSKANVRRRIGGKNTCELPRLCLYRQLPAKWFALWSEWNRRSSFRCTQLEPRTRECERGGDRRLRWVEIFLRF